MPLTAKQRELRRGRITASRAAACLGLSPYKSPADAFYEIVDDIQTETSEAAEFGNLAEPMLLNWAGQQLGCRVESDPEQAFRIDNDFDWLSATLDGWLPDRPDEIVQAKTFGATHYVTREDAERWGKPGTDEIPQEYLVQTQIEMRVTGAKVNHVPAYVGGRGLLMYRVERNDKLIEAMLCGTPAMLGLIAFYEGHVKPKLPPTNCLPCLDVIKGIVRVPNKIIPLDPALREAYQQAAAGEKAAKAAKETAQEALLAALGDAEAGDFGDGQIVTYLQYDRAGYTVEPGSYRSIKFKKQSR